MPCRKLPPPEQIRDANGILRLTTVLKEEEFCSKQKLKPSCIKAACHWPEDSSSSYTKALGHLSSAVDADFSLHPKGLSRILPSLCMTP